MVDSFLRLGGGCGGALGCSCRCGFGCRLLRAKGGFYGLREAVHV